MSGNFNFNSRRTGTFRETFGEAFGHHMGGFFAGLVKFIVICVVLAVFGWAILAFMAKELSSGARKHAPAITKDIKDTTDELTRPPGRPTEKKTNKKK